MSLEQTNQPAASLSRQDQIHWGILFLARKLRHLSPDEREQCLEAAWGWARERGDLLSLQMIRDYRECCKASGETYRRHREWFSKNRKDPEFWAEWDRRFAVSKPQSRTERSADAAGT